jgi:putative endonuclease
LEVAESEAQTTQSFAIGAKSRRTVPGIGHASSAGMTDRRIVYVIRSRKDSTRHYIGRTADVASRLASHNAGESLQTRNFAPWAIVVSVQFASEELAGRFERFLKSGSGRAFTKQFFA